ncbi:radical SAM protein [Dehalobacterium formicoaceticum]|uniref:radical SAM protein n=1 Tax=Dehalobacterium formicoaceticum TaxID=51515 RepID=UPI0031F6FD2B
MPDLLFARANGELLDFPGLKMAGRMGDSFVKPARKELIPLPEGASLTALPGRVPVGVDKKTGAFIKLTHNPYRRGKEKVWAVGALLPQGFTRTLIPAFGTSGEQKNLPLLGYTGVGIYQGRLMVAAIQTDEHEPWHPKHYNTRDLAARIRRRQQKFPHNRLLQQLATCSLEYGCFTAQNIFYGRWEGGLPVSPQCNAACIGCISSQPSECCPSPQRRLDFVPSVSEIEEIGADHLKKGKNAIISFGQGCEGEPSLQGGLIAESIKRIRTRTDCGTININTNAGDHGNIKKIISAGLDSMRVSLISPTPEVYDAYHRPGDYGLEQVRSSLIAAADAGVYTSLNLLTFPGFTDDAEEVASLISLIKATGVKKVQFRNLNIDPDQFMALLPAKKYQPMGIPRMIEHLRKEIPHLAIGNFSRSVAR